jgi:signal transduction histidine kinase
MRARLLQLVAGTSALVLVAFLVPLAILVRSAAADRAVSAAIVELQQLAPAVATLDEAALAEAVGLTNRSARYPLTVFLPSGSVLGVPAEMTPAVRQAATGQSLTAAVDGGREVVVAVAGLPTGTAVIRTLVPEAELTAGVTSSWLVLGLLGVILLAVALLVAYGLARSLTRPLTAAAAVSYRLARGDLEAQAPTDGPPEVRQVSAGLNLLAGRIAELLDTERATVADLSHRLRTPLTALRIDAESLADPNERMRLVAGLDALERRVDDVIRDIGRPAREGVRPVADAADIVSAQAHFWSVLAEEQGRPLAVTVAPGPILVRVAADDLAACVDALIGNVFAHTPDGTRFSVELAPAVGGGAQLVVSDDGPGLPDPTALHRGVSGAGSTGLGLDIVARTAGRSGGHLTIGRSPAGGASIAVHLGPPVDPDHPG